jgi:hypothetical protein
MAIDINIESQVSQTITDGVTDKAPSENAVFDALANKANTSQLAGLVPYTGAVADVNLGTHKLTAHNLAVNHPSGSGDAATITKGGSGEALKVVKSSGSGNAASITGGVTLLSELDLQTPLADSEIASAATWNGKLDKHDGATYDTNAIQTVTAAEYAALTPNASTLYFIV